MPRIELINVPLYQPNDPYNHQVDNLPIKAILDRLDLVNSQVDVNSEILRESVGTVGSLAARLAASLNDDGSLKANAINEADHNIARHSDGSIIVDGNEISYVRMLQEERNKLDLIESEANNLTFLFELDGSVPSGLSGISNISTNYIDEVSFTNGQIKLKNSDAISWRLEVDGGITANISFPPEVKHKHYYDVTPIQQNIVSPDYKNYKVIYGYKEGSLRVFINGVRISRFNEVYVPTSFGPSGPDWIPYSYTEDTSVNGIVTSGRFSLSESITASDEIRVDFDILV
jgi:hypothetical protein